MIQPTLEVEARLAAQWSGYTWSEFIQLPGSDRWSNEVYPDSQSSVIAIYRQAKRIENVANDVPPPKRKR